jgi:hypothetical protein
MSEIHFPPKIVDVDIDDVRHGLQFKLPNLLDNRSAGNGLPRMAHEKFKEPIFPGAERDFVTATMNGVGNAFQLEIRDLQNGARRAAASPQDRANARGKLGENEGFRNIVVGACIQPTDALFHVCGGGYDEHGKVRLSGANPPQDFQAHGARETKVENDKIVVLIQSQLLRFDAIRDDLHGELLLLQLLTEEIRERRVIFGDKYAH